MKTTALLLLLLLAAGCRPVEPTVTSKYIRPRGETINDQFQYTPQYYFRVQGRTDEVRVSKDVYDAHQVGDLLKLPSP